MRRIYCNGVHFPQNWTKREVGPSSGPKPHVELHINLLNLVHTPCVFLFHSYFSFGLVSCSIFQLVCLLRPAFSTSTPTLSQFFSPAPNLTHLTPKLLHLLPSRQKKAGKQQVLVHTVQQYLCLEHVFSQISLVGRCKMTCFTLMLMQPCS